MSQYGVIGGVALLLAGATVGSLFYLDGQPAAPATVAQSTAIPAPTAPTPMPVASAPAGKAPAGVPAASARSARHELFPSRDFREGQADGITVHYTQADPSLLGQLQQDQVLELALPGRAEPMRAQLVSTHNADGLEVWEARLLDGSPMESLTIVRGRLDTHISVATLQGSVSLVVDNASGQTVITDENALASRSDPHTDHVDAQPAALPPLPPPAQS